jgi:hypothetical protein
MRGSRRPRSEPGAARGAVRGFPLTHAANGKTAFAGDLGVRGGQRSLDRSATAHNVSRIPNHVCAFKVTYASKCRASS